MTGMSRHVRGSNPTCSQHGGEHGPAFGAERFDPELSGEGAGTEVFVEEEFHAPPDQFETSCSDRPVCQWSSARITSWYSVSRSTGTRPASSINRRMSATLSSCGE